MDWLSASTPPLYNSKVRCKCGATSEVFDAWWNASMQRFVDASGMSIIFGARDLLGDQYFVLAEQIPSPENRDVLFTKQVIIKDGMKVVVVDDIDVTEGDLLVISRKA